MKKLKARTKQTERKKQVASRYSLLPYFHLFHCSDFKLGSDFRLNSETLDFTTTKQFLVCRGNCCEAKSNNRTNQNILTVLNTWLMTFWRWFYGSNERMYDVHILNINIRHVIGVRDTRVEKKKSHMKFWILYAIFFHD